LLLPQFPQGRQCRSAIMGSSRDGRFSPSEQYGVQDGSGFPYPEIFVANVNANKWVKVPRRLYDEPRSRALPKAATPNTASRWASRSPSPTRPRTPGFEGVNRRFIAVPFSLP